MTVNELTFFSVSGNWIDVENPSLTGSTSTPISGIVSGFVLFTPRLPPGFVAYVPNLDNGGGVGYNTAVPIAPIMARILSGQLETIDASDTVGVQLLANTAILNLAAQGITNLIYDVSFSQVIFAENNLIPGWQPNLTNFAFTAPTTNTPICITDPNLVQLAYGGTAPTFQLPSNVSTFGATLLNAPDEPSAQGLLGIPSSIGSVTTVGVATANGFAGSVTNPTTTPSISVSTGVTGLLKGNGTGVTAASAGTDYLATVSSASLTDATTTGKALITATNAAAAATAVGATTTGAALLTAANAAAAQSTLNLTPGTNVQAYNANTYITGTALGTPTSGNLSSCTGGPSLTSATLTTPTISSPTITGTGIPNTAIQQAGINNFNTTQQSQATSTGTAYYIAGSALTMPATPLAGMTANHTTFLWNIAMNKDASSTGNTFAIILYRGTNGTTADTADVTQTISGAGTTAVADMMTLEIQLTVTTTGATGAYYWTIIPTSKSATATGFGLVIGPTGHFSGTISSVAMNTASLKFGVGFKSTGGTQPTITIPQVQAYAFNMD